MFFKSIFFAIYGKGLRAYFNCVYFLEIPCFRNMPRYNTLDCHANHAELDPTLAAEIRLKSRFVCLVPVFQFKYLFRKIWNWKTAICGLTLLLLLLIAAALAYIFLLPSFQTVRFSSFSKHYKLILVN
jgi:hypothetical protein